MKGQLCAGACGLCLLAVVAAVVEEEPLCWALRPPRCLARYRSRGGKGGERLPSTTPQGLSPGLVVVPGRGGWFKVKSEDGTVCFAPLLAAVNAAPSPLHSAHRWLALKLWSGVRIMMMIISRRFWRGVV